MRWKETDGSFSDESLQWKGVVRSLTTAEWVKAEKEFINEEQKREVIDWKEVGLVMCCIIVWEEKNKKIDKF